MSNDTEYVRGFLAGEGERVALATKLSDVRSDIRTFLTASGPDAKQALLRLEEFAGVTPHG
jgi:hypothetical protein